MKARKHELALCLAVFCLLQLVSTETTSLPMSPALAKDAKVSKEVEDVRDHKGIKTSQAGEEVLTFPTDITLGRLFKVTNYQGLPYEFEKRYFAQARGDVSIPAGSYVKLKLSFDGAADPRGLAKIAPHAVFMLDCRSLDNLNDQTLKSIAHLTNLHFLSLDETDTSDTGIEYLAPLKQIKHLALKRTNLTGKSFNTLKTFKTLVNLHLSYNQLKDASFLPLVSLKELNELDLESCGIGDGALPPIGLLPKLEELNLSRNEKISDAGLVSLKSLSRLHLLNIAQTRVTASGLQQLKGLPLTKIRFDMRNCSQADLVRLQKAFPECKISSGTQSGRSPDLFAPLK